MASVRGKTYDHMVEHLPSTDKLGNQYMVTPLFPESQEMTIVKVVGVLKLKLNIVKREFQTMDINTSNNRE